MKIEYLLFDLIVFFSSTISILLFKKFKFPNFKSAFISIACISTPYIIWDQLVTGWWWNFNQKFVTGFYLAKIPIEEFLFFFVVAWSCLILWVNIKMLVKSSLKFNPSFFIVFIPILLTLYSLLQQKIYAVMVFLGMLLIVIYDLLKNSFFNKVSSLIFLLLTVSLTTVFNGYLTSRPVVIYDSAEILGLKIYTIPIEDYFFGLIFLILVIRFYDYLEDRIFASC